MNFLYRSIVFVFLFFSHTSHAQIPIGLDLEYFTFVENNIGLAHAGDGSNRLFAIDQLGIIRVVDNQGNVNTAPFLDISNKVACCGEQGLLGLAFHPDYANNGYFYVSYNKQADDDSLGDSIIERYQVSSNPNIADVNSAVQLMRVVQDFGIHNGGDIHFGPDGYLYIGLGDGGDSGRSQDLSSALGKILRIDVNGNAAPARPTAQTLGGLPPTCPIETSHYSIPTANPYINNPNVCDEIWASGLRNPWRWSFDRSTGDMLIGDVGEDAREEINFQAASNKGGNNYGWNCQEGNIPTPGISCTNPPVFVEPILVKIHQTAQMPVAIDERGVSIVGGRVYRGPSPLLNGIYFYGDTFTSTLWLAREDNGEWTDDRWVFDPKRNISVVSIDEDEAGDLYVSELGGSVYRVTIEPADDLIFSNGFE